MVWGRGRKETLLRLRLRLRFTSTLLGSIRVVPLVDCSPDAWYHEVLRAICVGDDAIAHVNSRILTQVCKMMYLFAACETGIRSRSKSSLRRLFNSVSRRNLRSAIDCLFFLACDGSPTSREEYPEGIVVRWCSHEAVTTPGNYPISRQHDGSTCIAS